MTTSSSPPHGPWRRLDAQAFEGDIRVRAVDADLSVAVTDSPDPVSGLQTLTYTINVGNGGPDTASDVIVVDELPAAVSYLSASGLGWTCTQTTGVVTCGRPSLAPGAAPSITIRVTVPHTAGMLSNSVSVGSSTADSVNANNTDTETTQVLAAPQADLAVIKRAGGIAIRGQTLTYSITVSSSSNVTGATISDTFPADLTAVTWTCTSNNAVCTASGTGDIDDYVIILNAAGWVSYSATGTVSPASAGSLTNTASLDSPSGVYDPNPSNNTSTVMLAVHDLADVIFVDGFESGDTVNW